MRQRRTKETPEYLQAASRFIRRAGERCADADEPELQQLVELEDAVKRAVETAIAGHLARGRSFTWIGNALGTSRQAAQKRWGHLQP